LKAMQFWQDVKQTATSSLL